MSDARPPRSVIADEWIVTLAVSADTPPAAVRRGRRQVGYALLRLCEALDDELDEGRVRLAGPAG